MFKKLFLVVSSFTTISLSSILASQKNNNNLSSTSVPNNSYESIRISNNINTFNDEIKRFHKQVILRDNIVEDIKKKTNKLYEKFDIINNLNRQAIKNLVLTNEQNENLSIVKHNITVLNEAIDNLNKEYQQLNKNIKESSSNIFKQFNLKIKAKDIKKFNDNILDQSNYEKKDDK